MEWHEQSFTPWDRKSRPYVLAWVQPPPPPSSYDPTSEQPASTRPTTQDRPRPVTAAVVSLLYLAVATLLAIPLSYLGRDAMVEQALALQPELTPAAAELQVNAMLGVVNLLNFAGALLFAGLAFLVRGHRPVARIVATVVLALGGLGFAGQFFTVGWASPAAMVVNGSSVVALVLGLMSLWHQDVADYYTRKPRR